MNKTFDDSCGIVSYITMRVSAQILTDERFRATTVIRLHLTTYMFNGNNDYLIQSIFYSILLRIK